MTLLLPAASALVVVTIALMGVLVARRVWLGRQERRHAQASGRLRPVAIAFVAGDDEPLPEGLSAYDQTVLAGQLRRYAQSLSGEAAARIAAYFRESAAYAGAVAAVRSRRAWRRAEAAFALGDMTVIEAAPVLLDALGDRSRVVRTAAARGLGRLRSEEATVPLVDALVSRSVPRGVAGDALLRIGPKTVPRLLELIAGDEPEMQATALTLLGLVGDSGDANAAAAALRDPSAEVRAAAAAALGRIGTTSTEQALQTALDDRILDVRAAAATALGTIGTRSALPRLLEIASSDVFEPAREAARAAVKLDLGAAQAAAAHPSAGPHLHEAVDRAAL